MRTPVKQYTLDLIRAGRPCEADYAHPNARVRRAAVVALVMHGNHSDQQKALALAARDDSDVVYLSAHRAYLRRMVADASQ